MQFTLLGAFMIVRRVTLLGHKDHGKSTLIGNLLISTKSVSEARVEDAKRTSIRLGRKFEPGFLLDSFEEEREGAMTIDTTRAQIKYRGSAFEFIDVPGHEELIKNMISGASYADSALLIVSAKKGEGITGQTRRHIFLAKMLGIERVVVAVN
ncbi:translation elongation factor EF-1, subunit alpha, partial [mine drainage metagenome]